MQGHPGMSGFAATVEKQLCLSCLAPNAPVANFCCECGAPLSGYAATGPYETVFAEGAMYRRAIGAPRKPIVLIGTWLLFGMLALSGITPFVPGETAGAPALIWGASLLVISAVVLWLTTNRYLAARRRAKANAHGVAAG